MVLYRFVFQNYSADIEDVNTSSILSNIKERSSLDLSESYRLNESSKEPAELNNIVSFSQFNNQSSAESAPSSSHHSDDLEKHATNISINFDLPQNESFLNVSHNDSHSYSERTEFRTQPLGVSSPNSNATIPNANQTPSNDSGSSSEAKNISEASQEHVHLEVTPANKSDMPEAQAKSPPPSIDFDATVNEPEPPIQSFLEFRKSALAQEAQNARLRHLASVQTPCTGSTNE